MSGVIKQLCALTIFFGAVISITPEGGTKKVIELACTAALTLTVLLPIKGFDIETYALELAKYKQQEAELATDGSEVSSRLNRLVIENEYETYILDKAKELAMAVSSVDVQVQWSTEELWIPESVVISGEYTAEQKKKLTGIIKAELGIPENMQQWSGDGY